MVQFFTLARRNSVASKIKLSSILRRKKESLNCWHTWPNHHGEQLRHCLQRGRSQVKYCTENLQSFSERKTHLSYWEYGC